MRVKSLFKKIVEDEVIMKIQDDSALSFTIIFNFFLHSKDTETLKLNFNKCMCMTYLRKMRQNSE